MCCRSKPKPLQTTATAKNKQTRLNSNQASLTSNGKYVGNYIIPGSAG